MSVVYGNWLISYDPPPIPWRGADYSFCHKDFDGAEDACDDRCGHAASLADAMQEIDDYEGEHFECSRCSVADPCWCMAVKCTHRDDTFARAATKAEAKATAA